LCCTARRHTLRIRASANCRGLDWYPPGALDYIEGYYAGTGADGARAAPRARQAHRAHQRAGPQSAQSDECDVARARHARGRGKDTPVAEQRKDVTIFDIYQNAASAKIYASGWVDYLHLAKWNGRWVIVNVLWELHPRRSP